MALRGFEFFQSNLKYLTKYALMMRKDNYPSCSGEKWEKSHEQKKSLERRSQSRVERERERRLLQGGI